MNSEPTCAEQVFDALKYRVAVDAFGTRYYNSAGQLHRDEGPAIEWLDGTSEWWLQGAQHTETEYHAALAKLGFKT